MAFDAFIQIADIPGEALDEKYSKWIEITGYNFGVSQSTSATASSSGGASSGRTTMTNFTIYQIPRQRELQVAGSQLRWPASQGSKACPLPRWH
jgi:hypothetical protein